MPLINATGAGDLCCLITFTIPMKLETGDVSSFLVMDFHLYDDAFNNWPPSTSSTYITQKQRLHNYETMSDAVHLQEMGLQGDYVCSADYH